MDIQHVTIKTIAEETGFSTTTVSRVLNGTYRKYRVSEVTAKVIQEQAKKLGYIPNQAAVNLRLKKNHTIGLIVPNLTNPYFSTIASIISKAFYSRKYAVYMIDCDDNQRIEKDIVSTISSQNMDGLIVIPSGNDSRHLERLIRIKLPFICIDRYFESLHIPYVSTDNYIGALAAVELLVRNGHKKIACIQGNPTVVSNTERVRGYFEAIEKFGLDYSYVSGQEFTLQNGYKEMKKIINLYDRPTAIFTLSDMISLGVMRALKEEKLTIPNDFSLISFDNSQYLDYLETPLTSIAQPVEQIAEKAIELLLSQMKGELSKTKMSLLIPPTIIERNSIKKLN